MSAADEAAQLGDGARLLGLDPGAETVEKLLAYLDLLYAWNAGAGLTSIDREDAVRLHLLDSLACVPAAAAAATAVDLGAGGGLPGIPLAVVFPHLAVTLVETRRRKCSFLLEAVRELELRHCTVLEDDARVLAASGRTYDLVVSRAFMSPARFTDLAAPMVADAGRLVVMAGPEQDDDRDIGEAAQPHGLSFGPACRFTLPGGAETRRILLGRRTNRGPSG